MALFLTASWYSQYSFICKKAQENKATETNITNETYESILGYLLRKNLIVDYISMLKPYKRNCDTNEVK